MTTLAPLPKMLLRAIILWLFVAIRCVHAADLFKAADSGDVKAVQAALSQGTPGDVGDQDSWTPLSMVRGMVIHNFFERF